MTSEQQTPAARQMNEFTASEQGLLDNAGCDHQM